CDWSSDVSLPISPDHALANDSTRVRVVAWCWPGRKQKRGRAALDRDAVQGLHGLQRCAACPRDSNISAQLRGFLRENKPFPENRCRRNHADRVAERASDNAPPGDSASA